MSQLTGSTSGGATVGHAEAEVVDICRELIRIDTTNPGDGSGPGERDAAEYVAGLLSEVGLETEVFESLPRRANVVTRVPGADPTRPALLVHGHLDVVPARADDWQVDPFSAEVRDDCIWGRGAVDMKDMDAMILASVRELVRSGEQAPTGPGRRVPRRRGGGRRARRDVRRRSAARRPRGGLRGDQRGRRLQHPDRRPARVPAADGGEGHPLAAARRARPRRARLAGARRQRRDPALRGRRAHRHPPVASADHAHRPRLPRRRRGDHRRPARPGRPRRTRRDARDDGTLRRRHAADHREPDRPRGRVQAQRRPRHRDARCWTAASCPGARSSS